MAAYKKTPKGVASLSSFLTRAASLWFRMSARVGPLKDKLPYCTVRATGRRYRLFRLSVFRLKEGVFSFTSAFTRDVTSATMKLFSFSGICSGISIKVLSSCGTGVWFTGQRKLSDSLRITAVSMLTTFLHMPRSSILMSSFGPILNTMWLTAFPNIFVILETCLINLCKGLKTPENSCCPVLRHRSSHGYKIVSITFA